MVNVKIQIISVDEDAEKRGPTVLVTFLLLDKTPLPRQLIKESVKSGLHFQRARVMMVE